MYAFGALLLVPALGVALVGLYNWACPACDNYLGKGFNPHFCSKCGLKLQRAKLYE